MGYSGTLNDMLYKYLADGTLAAPTDVLRGGVLLGAAVEDATDEASAVVQLNALLAALRTSGALAE